MWPKNWPLQVTLKVGPFPSFSSSREEVFTIDGRKRFVTLDSGGRMGREERKGGTESAWSGLMRMDRARREMESGRLRTREGIVLWKCRQIVGMGSFSQRCSVEDVQSTLGEGDESKANDGSYTLEHTA